MGTIYRAKYGRHTIDCMDVWLYHHWSGNSAGGAGQATEYHTNLTRQIKSPIRF